MEYMAGGSVADLAMETLVSSAPREHHVPALEDKSDKPFDKAKRPAPLTGGCRVEGFVRVKKGGLSLASSTSGSLKFSAEQSMDLGKNPRTNHDMTFAKGKDIIKTSPKKELESKGSTSSNSEQKRPRTADAKTLRRLAQNREAAKKSRIRKKAHILQLENSRIKLIQLEQELHRAKTQGLFINSSSSSVNGPSSVLSKCYLFQ